MERKAQYYMYKIAHQLAATNGYDVLYMNDKDEEIWLEKYEQKTSNVIRVSTLGFDWKNHLKKDIARVFQKTNAMRKMLQGKNIEVHNVYITPHTPIDSWEILKKPMMIQEKDPIKMKTYYLSGDEIYKERDRLGEDIGVSFVSDVEFLSETQIEQDIQRFKLELVESVQQKRREAENVFSFGKPIITYLLIGINAILYLLLEFNGGSQSNETLIEYGAKFNPAIMDGEWWRILTSMFLHIGILHFLSNMLFLYYFGSLAERIFGSIRFFIIFMLAGIGGSVASFAFITNLSAGASGALYGLFGAFIYFGLFYRKLFYQTIGKNILILLAINIGLGFFLPQLDVVAHFGGLITGFVAAAIVHLPNKKKPFMQFLAFLFYGMLIIGTALFGIDNNSTSGTYQLMNIDMLLQEDRYEDIVDSATKGMIEPDGYEAILLFQRSYAYIQINELDSAIKDLERSVQLVEEPEELPEAFHNLALLYYEVGDERAEEMVREAYRLNPTDQKVIDLYQSITGEKVSE